MKAHGWKHMSIKVLEVLNYVPETPWGMEVYVIDTVEAMDKEDLSIDFLTFHTCKNPDYLQRIQKMGCSYIPFSFPAGTRTFSMIPSMRRFLKENHYDVLHVNSAHILELTTWAFFAKKAGIPKVITHIHNANSTDNTFIHRIKTAICRPILLHCSDICCACSMKAAAFVYGEHNLGNVKILKNGIRVHDYQFDEQKRINVRKKYSINNSDFVIGHVGRFSPEKNHRFLVHVFHELLKKEPNSRLMLVGSGVYMKQIENLVDELGIATHVVFVGYQEDVASFLQAMDVFCFPSKHEAFGMAALEAQASGLPAVVSDVLPPEIKQTDCVTFLSLEQTEADWADALLKYRHHYRKDQTESILKSGYDIDSTASQVRDLYFSK